VKKDDELKDETGTGTYVVFTAPERSEWTCRAFGTTGESMYINPLKGGEPNWFWRWMQFLVLGNRWTKGKP